MKNILVVMVTLFVSLFVLVFSLVLFIPLSIIALITGKKLQRRGFRFQPNQFGSPDGNMDNSAKQGKVIEGDYQDVSDKSQKS